MSQFENGGRLRTSGLPIKTLVRKVHVCGKQRKAMEKQWIEPECSGWQVRTFNRELSKLKADEITRPLVSYLLTVATLEADRLFADFADGELLEERAELSRHESRVTRFQIFLCEECARLPRSRYYWETVASFVAASSTVARCKRIELRITTRVGW